MRSKLIAGLVLALVIPTAALAAKPVPPPGNSGNSHSKAAPKVVYVLKGTVTSYVAAAGATNGTLAIANVKANHYRALLKGAPLSFSFPSTTKIVFFKNATTISVGDKVIVKVKAAKTVPSASTATVTAALQAAPPAAVIVQIIDQGSSS